MVIKAQPVVKTTGVTKNTSKISKTIGWMNKNSLQTSITYAEVKDALESIGEDQACRLLNELDEKAYSISNPTGWLQKAAARVASGESNPSKSSGGGSKWGGGGSQWGGGGGGGSWLDLSTVLSMLGKGGGKSFGKGGGKGFGKGKGKGKDSNRATLMKLREIDADRKVWIGGLPSGLTWKDLEKHMEATATKPMISELMSKGTGVCAFKTAEDAAAAIVAANGSELKGSTIEVDVWTTKEKGEKK